MNILVITTLLPYPLNSGGAQAQFNMIDELRKKHNIFLLFTEDRMNTLGNMRKLSELWPEVTFFPYRYIWQMRNPQFVYNKLKRGLQTYLTPNSQAFRVDKALRPICIYQSSHLEHYINKIIDEQEINVVQIEFFPAIKLVYCLPSKVRKVFIQHEINFVKNKRYFQSMKLTASQQQMYLHSRQDEIDAMNAYDVVVTLTEVDKRILLDNGVTAKVFPSPCAVNTPAYNYEPWNGHFVFLGSYTHIPNKEGVRWLMQRVAPLLMSNDERYVIDVVGQGWPDFPETESININSRGFVEDIHDAIGGCVMLVPILSGSGMRMKILEAAASNVPFITTTVGVEGLDFKDNESCIIADTPQEFASAMQKLAHDEDLRHRLAQKAHELYLERYTTKSLAEVRNQVYSETFSVR